MGIGGVSSGGGKVKEEFFLIAPLDPLIDFPYNECMNSNPESDARIQILAFCKNATTYLLNAFNRDDSFSDDDTDYIPAATRCLDFASSALLDFDSPTPCFDLLDALSLPAASRTDAINEFILDILTLDFPTDLRDLISDPDALDYSLYPND